MKVSASLPLPLLDSPAPAHGVEQQRSFRAGRGPVFVVGTQAKGEATGDVAAFGGGAANEDGAFALGCLGQHGGVGTGWQLDVVVAALGQGLVAGEPFGHRVLRDDEPLGVADVLGEGLLTPPLPGPTGLQSPLRPSGQAFRGGRRPAPS